MRFLIKYYLSVCVFICLLLTCYSSSDLEKKAYILNHIFKSCAILCKREKTRE